MNGKLPRFVPVSILLGAICLSVVGVATSASAIVLLDSRFDGTSGQDTIVGPADDSSGSNQVTVTWTTQETGLDADTSLNLLPGAPGGGFTIVQGGANNGSNNDVVFVNSSLVTATGERRGFSFDLDVDPGFVVTLENLFIYAGLADQNGVLTTDGRSANASYQILLGATQISTNVATREFDNEIETLNFASVGGVQLTGGNTYTINAFINNAEAGDARYASLDGFRLQGTIVPEPGTAALLGLGLTGLGVVGRSRRRATHETA